jgi:hypothetical protein
MTANQACCVVVVVTISLCVTVQLLEVRSERADSPTTNTNSLIFLLAFVLDGIIKTVTPM